jgi:hypothetical protein
VQAALFFLQVTKGMKALRMKAPVTCLSIVIALALALQGARMRSLGARLMRWADAALMPRLRLPRLRLPKLRRA